MTFFSFGIEENICENFFNWVGWGIPATNQYWKRMFFVKKQGSSRQLDHRHFLQTLQMYNIDMISQWGSHSFASKQILSEYKCTSSFNMRRALFAIVIMGQKIEVLTKVTKRAYAIETEYSCRDYRWEIRQLLHWYIKRSHKWFTEAKNGASLTTETLKKIDNKKFKIKVFHLWIFFKVFCILSNILPFPPKAYSILEATKKVVFLPFITFLKIVR